MKRNPFLITTLGLVIGAVAGWLYWRWVGCSSGACLITSHPMNSALYGAGMGGLLVNAIFPSRNTSDQHERT